MKQMYCLPRIIYNHHKKISECMKYRTLLITDFKNNSNLNHNPVIFLKEQLLVNHLNVLQKLY